MSTLSDEPSYLRPYLAAARAHGSGFGALLWASPRTQEVRFEAISRLAELNGKSVLDAGCGRADLLQYLLARGVQPADYIGIEAIGELASAAEARRLPGATILRADFIAEPARLFVGADVVVVSGALNTADDAVFYSTLARAFDAAAETLVFNFLCSPMLAGREYLHWRRPQDVTRFARGLCGDVSLLDDYLPGDMTVRLGKPQDASP